VIASGVDYFFGLRRVLKEAEQRREAAAGAASAETEPTAP